MCVITELSKALKQECIVARGAKSLRGVCGEEDNVGVRRHSGISRILTGWLDAPAL
jgi:hypothetical protein